jgi:hypothetical protein
VGPLQVGTTLSQKYKIERLLAESGGTVLYEATDTARKQRVWIKIMQQESLANAAAMAKFQREAAGAKVLDVGKNDAGLPYMVATEFGPPEKPAMPPRPSADPRSGTPPRQKPQKTTLPGVAPPPTPKLRIPTQPKIEARKEEEEEAPISGSDLVEETPTPAPAAAGIFSAPPAQSNPVLANPLVTTPPPEINELEIPEPDPLPDNLAPFVEDPIVELPAATPSEPTMKRRRQAAAPTVFIDRPKERSQTGVWVVALVLASIVTGGAGWYFGHKDTRVAPRNTTESPPVTTTTVAAATTTQTVETKPEPPPTVTATMTATATATATATTTTTTAMVTATATTAAVNPTVLTSSPPPKKPPVRKPPVVAHPPSGDPLTL